MQLDSDRDDPFIAFFVLDSAVDSTASMLYAPSLYSTMALCALANEV